MNKEEVKAVCKDLRVLYVEDDKVTQESFGHLLKSLFFSVIVADDGQEGVKLYQNNAVDLVITDIKMPKVDGFEMIRQIQSVDPDVVFAITTAYVDSDFFLQAIDLGVGAYIIKPVERQRVLKSLHSIAKIAKNRNKARQLESAFKKLQVSNDMIDKLSYYHPLTQLPNKKSLLKKIKARKGDCALIYFNIDNFGSINDTQGMQAGDEVLKDFAKRFERSSFNQQIFHIQSDEFVVIFPVTNTKKQNTTKQVQSVYDTLVGIITQPFMQNSTALHLTVSAGVVVMASSDAKAVDDAINNAKNAMKIAKSSGKNTLHFFDPSLQTQALQRSKILRKLSHAYEQKQFFMHYQKQYDSRQNIIGAEALIRWEDPKKGTISPGEFIPVAEESGFIIQLGEWILKESIQKLAHLQKQKEKQSWKISVNISPLQFKNEFFVGILQQLLRQYEVDATKLRLEITEGILVDNVITAIHKLGELKKLGCTVSIDDFGTGYSSLVYLKQLPIDELKIDQSFVKNLTMDNYDETIVKTIINMGKAFGFEVISEGVEKAEQFEKLKKMGCDHFQGFLFARPDSSI